MQEVMSGGQEWDSMRIECERRKAEGRNCNRCALRVSSVRLSGMWSMKWWQLESWSGEGESRYGKISDGLASRVSGK
jgi:hypothetical protein